MYTMYKHVYIYIWVDYIHYDQLYHLYKVFSILYQIKLFAHY